MNLLDIIDTCSLAAGFIIGGMIFAITFTVLLSRWVAGDEDGPGLWLRTAALVGLGLAAARLFRTFWYWTVLPAVLFMMVDFWWGEGFSALWRRRLRRDRLGKATADAAHQPHNPFQQVVLARAYFDDGQLDDGLAALARAADLSTDSNRGVVADMIQEVKDEFLHTCPRCGRSSPWAAKVCRHCYTAFSPDLFLRLALRLCRPLLVRLP